MLYVGSQALKKIQKKFQCVVVFGLAALLFSGCQPNRESVCRDLPTSQGDLRALQASLEPQSIVDTKVGRKLASITGTRPGDPAPEMTAGWLKWAEKELKRAQWARDAFENDREGRKGLPALNEASLSLVSFHGYVDQKKWRKAFLELKKIDGELTKVSQLACGGK